VTYPLQWAAAVTRTTTVHPRTRWATTTTTVAPAPAHAPENPAVAPTETHVRDLAAVNRGAGGTETRGRVGAGQEVTRGAAGGAGGDRGVGLGVLGAGAVVGSVG
jgi:hypothetical protein